MSSSYLLQISIESGLAIMCLSIWLCTYVQNRSRQLSSLLRFMWYMLLIVSGLLVSDILAIVYRGNVTTAGFFMVRISNFLVFVLVRSLLLYAIVYARRYLYRGEKRCMPLHLATVTTMISFLLLVLNLAVPMVYGFDANNRYYRMNGWYALSVMDILAVALVLAAVIRKREEINLREQICLYISIAAPLAAAAIQVFIYGISVLVIIIGLTQIVLFFISYLNAFWDLSQKESEVEDYNMRLILTQLQPHFMLNALSAIQYLCKTDPEAAASTIADLNSYIRNNMEFSQSSHLIPFTRELEHIDKYFSIEQKRFGDRIHLVKDIQEQDFMLPPLTVQPLVENAVKHGISKKRAGGTVTIRTRKEPGKICIVVKDDGNGFDPEAVPSDDRPHIGMKIVRERVEKQYGGTMRVASIPGEGTTIKLELPIDIE